MAFEVLDEPAVDPHTDFGAYRTRNLALGRKPQDIDEDIRQIQATQKADSMPDSPSNSGGFQVLNEGSSPTQGFKVLDESEGKQGASNPYLENLKAYIPSWATVKDALTPRTSLADITSPEYWNNIGIGATSGAALGMLGGNPVVGGAAGALAAPLMMEGHKREVERFRAMGYSPEEAAQRAGVSSTVLGLGTGLVGQPKVQSKQDFLQANSPQLSTKENLYSGQNSIETPPLAPPEARSFTPESHPSLTPPGVSIQETGKFVQPPSDQLRLYPPRPQKYFKPAFPTGTAEPMQPVTQALKSMIRKQGKETYDALTASKVVEDGFSTSPIVKEQAPGMGTRAFASTWDELGSSGPLGQEAKRIAVEDIDGMSERLASEWNLKTVDNIFTKWLGKRSLFSQHNPLKVGETTLKTYQITPAEKDELIDYLYTMNGKYGQVLEPKSTRIKGLGDEMAKVALPIVENHPGVRQALVFQPGVGKVPVGSAGQGFYPHNPVSNELRDGLSGRAFKLAYEQAQKRGFSGTESAFRQSIREDRDGQWRRYAGLELGRTFDATKGGTARPSQVLRELGYGTDPIEDFFRWSTGTFRRGQQILAAPKIDELERAFQAQWSGDPKSLGWIQGMLQRMKGSDMEFPDKFFHDWVTKANNITNLSLLQWSGPAQLNQFTYSFGRHGLAPLVQGIARLPANIQSELMVKSGAYFPKYANMYTPNADMFGRALQRELQINGMMTIDGMGRGVAAMMGDSHINNAMKFWSAFPQSPYLQRYTTGLLREAHFSPDQIARIEKTRQLTLEDRVQYAHHMSSYTQGRTGFRGLPTYVADSQGAWGRLTFNIKKFAFSNATEVRRQLVEGWNAGIPAPVLASRAVRLGLGAVAVGEVQLDMVHALKEWSSPFDDRRTPKWMRKSFGDQWGRVAEDFSAGMGNIAVSLVLSYSDSLHDAMVKAIMPVVLERGYKAGEALYKLALEGDPEDLERFLSRSTIGQAIPEKTKKHALGGGMMRKGSD